MTETIEPMPAQIDQQQLAQERVEKARAEGVDLVDAELADELLARAQTSARWESALGL